MTWWKRPKAVIDTNIFISGILFSGNPAKILRLFRTGEIELLLSPELEAEILRKLSAFGVNEDLIADLKFVLEEKSIKIIPLKSVKICRDPKDNMILALAQEGKAAVVITGDKDLLILRRFGGAAILTPSQFLENFSRN
ncbi:MAG: putative toxin-antitoxin system toxin component, PIN family [Patescibacteria group bacterium]